MRLPFASLRGLLRSREEIFRDASDARQFDAVYFAMLILSCLIALLGLLLNSPAIIIGGMLISPMMGPILACGIALTTADGVLGRKASWNLALSTGEVVLIAVIATWLSPLKTPTPEILARTNPNLMDLLVAFFSGLAGTLALSSRKSGLAILPGVAIATAVMPPLATVGYGLSTGQWVLARGAFMLFSTNVTAIVISAELVFFLVGFRPSRHKLPEGTHLLVRHRTLIATAILLVLSVPLLRTLMQAAHQVQLRYSISAALQEQTSRFGCRLDKVELRIGRKSILVSAVVQTPQYIEAPEIELWERQVSSSVGRNVRIDLQQLQMARRREAPVALPPNRDFVAGGTIRPASPEPVLSPALQLEKLQSKAQDSLQAMLSPAGVGALQVSSLAARSDGVLLLQLTGVESAPSADAAWSVAASALSAELRSPVRITGALLISNASTDLRYAPKAVRPSAKTLRATDQFLAQWKNQPAIRYAFVAADDPLAARRLDFLRRHYANSVSLPEPPYPEVSAAPAKGIRMQMVHRIQVESPLVISKVPSATAPQPAASNP
jgi:uncharacterized hydrophobic protein (TIGR00271 family)